MSSVPVRFRLWEELLAGLMELISTRSLSKSHLNFLVEISDYGYLISVIILYLRQFSVHKISIYFLNKRTLCVSSNEVPCCIKVHSSEPQTRLKSFQYFLLKDTVDFLCFCYIMQALAGLAGDMRGLEGLCGARWGYKGL
jgi:hypothetical protein